MSDPYIMIKVGDQQEVNLCDQITGLRYLGLDDASSSPQFTNQYQDTTGTDGSPFAGQTFAKGHLARNSGSASADMKTWY